MDRWARSRVFFFVLRVRVLDGEDVGARGDCSGFVRGYCYKGGCHSSVEAFKLLNETSAKIEQNLLQVCYNRKSVLDRA